MSGSRAGGFRGPKCWALSATAGALLGALLTRVLPAEMHDGHGAIPLWLLAPFALLLASIALMPFISTHVWHDHFPDFSFFLGSIVVAYYLLGYTGQDGHMPGLSHGAAAMLHSGVEYYAFIALVGGLYVVSGAILVDVRARGTPAANTALLAVGAVIANIFGTTGASMLLIRPFLRINRGRLRPIHVVLFIFIVSNCGGCLTPIGDPPLYLGYLKGVPFFWTLEHLWMNWLFVVGCLLAVAYAIDRWVVGAAPAGTVPTEAGGADGAGRAPVRVRGWFGLLCLGLMLVGVFIDPMLASLGVLGGVPVGATFQVLVAIAAWRFAPRDIHAANEFTFFPVKEVGLLFLGIFATMTPALAYLSVHGKELGIDSPTSFYYIAGLLSAMLDNAPTYLNFLQIAFASPALNPLAPGDTSITAETVRQFLFIPPGTADRPLGVKVLDAVSVGSVFFGALTYIGNGPNFMVKAIAEASGVRMPSFLGYLARALLILMPILVVHWALFIR